MTSFSGSSYPPSTPSSSDSCSTASIPFAYRMMANEFLNEKDLSVNDDRQLNVIIQAGLEARAIFFAAVLYDPTQQELDLFFTDFVLRCVIPVGPGGTQ